MKGKLGKIGIICLALVLALGTLGGAFAFWNEPVTINSAVNTGYLQLKLTNIECTDSEDTLGLEDVGQISCTKTDGGPEYDFTEFTIKVENASPGYWGRCTFDIENTGTIPARIYDVEFDDGIPYWAEVTFNQLLNAKGVYLGVNEWVPGHITVEIFEKGVGKNGVEVECQENYSFDFTVTIHAVQWNAP